MRSLDDFQTLLRMGADKVAVNAMSVEQPEFLTEAARLYGTQCVVVSMDAKKEEDGSYQVYSHFGSKPTGFTPQDLAQIAQKHDAGEILIQSIDRDGTLEGYDLELVKHVNDAVSIPVLASSGAGNWQHFVDAINFGGASAACTANIYHFTESSIQSAKQYLHNHGVDVRI